MTDNASISATSTKATSTSTFSFMVDAIKRAYLVASSISGTFLHYHAKNLEQAYLDFSKNFTKQESKEKNVLNQKMNAYCRVVAYMLTFQTQMPPEIHIDAIALGLWKLYISELAISIENQVVKTFDEHNVVSKGTNKSKS
eukprot:1728418-Ditylum_brightwellii.AAC.1